MYVTAAQYGHQATVYIQRRSAAPCDDESSIFPNGLPTRDPTIHKGRTLNFAVITASLWATTRALLLSPLDFFLVPGEHPCIVAFPAQEGQPGPVNHANGAMANKQGNADGIYGSRSRRACNTVHRRKVQAQGRAHCLEGREDSEDATCIL